VGLDVLGSRCEQALQVGLKHALVASEPGVEDKLRDLTEGGAHLVIDASGNVQGELLAVRAVRDHGEVVLLGSPWAGGGDVPIGDLFQRIHIHYIHIRSGWEWSVPRLPSPYSRGSTKENLALAVQLIAEGKIPARKLLTGVVAPEDAQRVYTELTEHRDRCLTFAFRWA
jgi:threonine dehydrogenase-like Zn-dependent dehydrogenase